MKILSVWLNLNAVYTAQFKSRATIAICLTDARADIIELHRQRDELITALKFAKEMITANINLPKTVEKIDSVLNKVEGKQS